MIDSFIESLPDNQPVKVKPERIAEWPFIEGSLIWPNSINRLKAISNSKANPLEKVIPKYIESLKEEGYTLSNDGTYIFENVGSERRSKNQLFPFFKILKTDTHRYLRKRKNRSFREYIMAGSYVLLQLPEKISNYSYTFPKLEKNEGVLNYVGPTLSEFANSRKYLDPLRSQARKLKQHLVYAQ